MLNSLLSSLSIYYLSLFKVSKSVILKLDLIRKIFLWVRVDIKGKRKYHLARWDALCIKKNLQVGEF
jgi:hypothetical protein